MVEQIYDKRLFHVTANKPYKQALVADQKLRIGDEYNPFFKFYESALEYAVNDNGRIVQVKAVSWLHRVSEGTISTDFGTLARIGYEVTQHYVTLCRELLMEQIRLDKFEGEPPSRQRCLYACDTLEQARYWNMRIGDNGTICELNCTGTIHRADARLLLGDSEPLSVTQENARRYWAGELGPDAELETLFVGDAVVTAYGLT